MNRDPWASYWTASGAAQPSVCLPEGGQRIGVVLDRIWRDFAAELPRRARVLDLATGNGIVLQRLISIRRDLKPVGIDSSPVLPAAPRGIRLMPATSMEDLPFPDRSFDGIASQFGIEYGDTARIATEVARIAKRDARIRFVLHHNESPVVSHNLARREALVWAARESGLLERALRLASARRTAPIPTPPSFRSVLEEARRRFPTQPVATEFAAAVAQSLDGISAPNESIRALEALKARSDDEAGRIDALTRAVCDAQRIARIVAEFRGAGLRVAEPSPLCEQAGASPFAWLLGGRAG